MPRVGSLSTSTLGGQVSHLASATFCWLPPDRLCSSVSTVGGRIDSASAWRRAMSRSTPGLSHSRAMRPSTLIDMFL